MTLVRTNYPASQSYDTYRNMDEDSVFGGPEDTFGIASLTTDTLKDPSFQIEFDAAQIGSGGQVMVDSIEIEVFYSKTIAPPEMLEIPPIIPRPWAASAIGRRGNGHSTIVLVGEAGKIAYSNDDGQNWTEITVGTAECLWDVVYNGSIFIAVGNGGTILTSSDGETWEFEDAGTSEHIYAVGRSRGSSLAREGASIVAGTNIGGILKRPATAPAWGRGGVRS